MIEEVELVAEGLAIDKSTWSKVKFGDVAIQQKENVDRDNTDLTRYVAGEHMGSEDLHIRNWGEVNDDYLGPAFIRKFEAGDILYGSRRTYLRKVAVAHFDGITANTTFVIKPNEDLIVKELLPFIMLSEAFTQHSIRNSKGSVNPYINWKDIASYEFLLPPKDQQEQIVEILVAGDEVVEGYWNTKAILEASKRRIAYDCYYSDEVDKINLEDLCTKIQDGSHFSPKEIYSENDGTRYRYVTSKNIRTTGIEFRDHQFVDQNFHDSIFQRCDVRKGDVLLTKDGANTGTATLNSLEEEFSLLSSVCLIRANNKTSNEYLCHYFNSDTGNYDLVSQMTGTAITRLTLTTLRKIKVPIPSLDKQDEVVQKLNSMDVALRNAFLAIENSKSLLKSIINQIF